MTLVALGSPTASEPAHGGGKASALSRLAAAGHRVPPGFVLTPAAFAPDGALSDAARAALGPALAALGGPVAVRSSGLAEDLVGASFAGLYETVLHVEGQDAVEAAVARCTASARAPRVAEYRARHGIAAAPMAVLVQKMVPARAAGVAFTAHPVTGERGVVAISAVRGVGEALVSGLADAEEWEVRAAAVRCRGVGIVLSEADADAIAALARSVAEGPTDVEWALTEDGVVHLLQARPMTALPEPVSWECPVPRTYLRNFRLGEWIGAPVTPLFESWILTDLEAGVHRWFEGLFGVTRPDPLHVVVNGWYFYGGMGVGVGLVEGLRALWRTLWTLLGPHRHAALAATPPLAWLGFDRELERWRRELLPALRSTVASVESRVDGADPTALVGLVDEIVAATTDQLASIVGVAGYAAKAEGALYDFLKKHLPGGGASPVALVSGGEHVPAAHDVEGLDPVFPCLGELGPLPEGPSAATRARVDRERADAEARTLAALPERRRAAFAKLLAEGRRAHAARLEQTAATTLGWPVLRRALLRLGDDLVRRGVIPERGDVFFVRREELGATSPLPVAERRATWERQRRLSPPTRIGPLTGMWAMIEPELEGALRTPEHDATDALAGMPGSPGRVTGPARVVRSVAELERLRPGEILVCPVSTPAWTLAFGRALAIVTDTGSIASHASIVAREHGIPAVVGTGTATARIVDGQRITVDGGAGVVRLQPA